MNTDLKQLLPKLPSDPTVGKKPSRPLAASSMPDSASSSKSKGGSQAEARRFNEFLAPKEVPTSKPQPPTNTAIGKEAARPVAVTNNAAPAKSITAENNSPKDAINASVVDATSPTGGEQLTYIGMGPLTAAQVSDVSIAQAKVLGQDVINNSEVKLQSNLVAAAPLGVVRLEQNTSELSNKTEDALNSIPNMFAVVAPTVMAPQLINNGDSSVASSAIKLEQPKVEGFVAAATATTVNGELVESTHEFAQTSDTLSPELVDFFRNAPKVATDVAQMGPASSAPVSGGVIEQLGLWTQPTVNAPTESLRAHIQDAGVPLMVNPSPATNQSILGFADKFAQLQTDTVNFNFDPSFAVIDADSMQSVSQTGALTSPLAWSMKENLSNPGGTQAEPITLLSADELQMAPKEFAPIKSFGAVTERLFADNLLVASPAVFAGGEGFVSDEDGGFEESDQELVIDLDAPNFSTNGLVDKSSSAFQQMVTPLEQAAALDLNQRIADAAAHKAQMITNQDGGMIKLDLGSDVLGKLEIAINVQRDNVDVKVLTASEKTKDLLMHDVDKLRDALSAQNLELKQVSFGFKREFDFNQNPHQRSNFLQQQFQDHQQAQKQYQAYQSASMMNAKTGVADHRVTAAMVNGARAGTLASHSGNIQVLI